MLGSGVTEEGTASPVAENVTTPRPWVENNRVPSVGSNAGLFEVNVPKPVKFPKPPPPLFVSVSSVNTNAPLPKSKTRLSVE